MTHDSLRKLAADEAKAEHSGRVWCPNSAWIDATKPSVVLALLDVVEAARDLLPRIAHIRVDSVAELDIEARLMSAIKALDAGAGG